MFIINDSTITDPATGNLKRKYTGGDGLWIQAGSESGTGFYLKRAKVSTNFLGIDSVDVSTAETARSSIDLIKNGLQVLNTQRSDVGAQQNRMEHTINNLDNIVENTTAAESRIRDTDMATEMVQHSNNNILAQVGQSMLAQANQSKQGILSLLS